MIELNLIIKHKRERENDDRKFSAAIAGVDLEKDSKSSIESRLEEVRQRANTRLAGGEQELEKMELADLGWGYEAV